VVRQRLARAHTGLEIMRLNALRTPDSLVTKLYWATVHRSLGELAMDVLGAGALVDGPESDALRRLFLFSRADTIYGGSNQVQRNIIGERALGLPKEPK
jgi:alkylation response protein AidB-like acyl-CoA dehydrogenase